MAEISSKTLGDDGTLVEFVFDSQSGGFALVMIFEDNKISTHIEPDEFVEMVVPLLAAIGPPEGG